MLDFSQLQLVTGTPTLPLALTKARLPDLKERQKDIRASFPLKRCRTLPSKLKTSVCTSGRCVLAWLGEARGWHATAAGSLHHVTSQLAVQSRRMEPNQFPVEQLGAPHRQSDISALDQLCRVRHRRRTKRPSAPSTSMCI